MVTDHQAEDKNYKTFTYCIDFFIMTFIVSRAFSHAEESQAERDKNKFLWSFTLWKINAGDNL